MRMGYFQRVFFPCLWQIKLKQRRVNKFLIYLVIRDLNQCLGTTAADIQDEVSGTHLPHLIIRRGRTVAVAEHGGLGREHGLC